MSVAIYFDNVVKKYGDNVVIPGLSLQVQEGEFFTLLGPSGCGKTTLLRMVAGFNSIEEGIIRFNNNPINSIPPGRRNIGMVFQNYAIFPHMTVEKNVAFGLGNRSIAKDEIKKRVNKILNTVQIEEYRNRMPDKLSGGQQQRVALARAIVIEPDVLLMDEPLSNLDAKLRVDMRNAIKDIQNQINITTIYVTHDQEEAMAVSDRIAIMDKGVIQQIGTPQEIYQRPLNLFVATFIGHTNILEGVIDKRSKMLTVGHYQVMIPNVDNAKLTDEMMQVRVSVRPEEFIISQDGQGIDVKIVSSIFLGLNTHYFVEMANGKRIEIVQQSKAERVYRPGTELRLKIATELVNIFDENGEKNLIEGV